MIDQRLYDAARRGDVALPALLNEDPLILDKICLTEFAETPLHVAALAGRTEFAKEIITLMPSFAIELNKDGFAPMHLASARGHVEMVMELLKFDTDCSLCHQRDKSGRIPLHYAVAKGRILIIEQLIPHCSESLQEVTALGETVLHLAVKNSQIGALEVVLETLKGHERSESLMSTKDNRGKGKTIVELAEAAKQEQVLELLKEYQNSHKDNDASAKGAGSDDEIMEADRHSIDIPSDPGTDDKQESKEEGEKKPSVSEMHSHAGTHDKQKSESGGKEELSVLDMDNLVLVAAALIATVTYQAVLEPPSTIWKENLNLNARCRFKLRSLQKLKHDCPTFMYYYFMFFNTAAFLFSVGLILFITIQYGYLRLRLLTCAIFLLLLNYIVLVLGLSQDSSSASYVLFVPLLIITYVCCAFIFFRKILQIVGNKPHRVEQAK